MTRHTFPRPGRGAFTLVELLVSMAILSLMLVALATAMNYAARVWIDSVGTVDNFTKARVMLNIMDRDVQMMILRRDLPAFSDSTGANAACAFYTMQQGNPETGVTTPDDRSISLVQYTLAQIPTGAPTTSVLQRLNCGMNFANPGTTPAIGNTNTTTLTGFTTGSLTQLSISSGTVTDNVATGVIAFQWQFVDGYGDIKSPPYIPTNSSSTTSVPFAYDFVYPGDQANPRAIIISMLVLSNPAYTIATQNNTLSNLVTCFNSTSAPINTANPTYGQAWNALLNAPSSAFLSLPAPERHGIEVFQRYIPLPVTTPSS